MLVLVTLMIASLGSLMIGSATSSHETSRNPCQVTAFIVVSRLTPVVTSVGSTPPVASAPWASDARSQCPSASPGHRQCLPMPESDAVTIVISRVKSHARDIPCRLSQTASESTGRPVTNSGPKPARDPGNRPGSCRLRG